jgi:hypothetical protein
VAPGTAGRIRVLDISIVVWTVVWIVLGALSFVEVRGLRSLSETMSLGGQSLQNAADALESVASVPFVGAGIRSTAEEVQRLATETVAEAQTSRGHINRLSALILLMGGLVPIVSGWIVWALLRRAWTESAAQSGGLEHSGGAP